MRLAKFWTNFLGAVQLPCRCLVVAWDAPGSLAPGPQAARPWWVAATSFGWAAKTNAGRFRRSSHLGAHPRGLGAGSAPDRLRAVPPRPVPPASWAGPAADQTSHRRSPGAGPGYPGPDRATAGRPWRWPAGAGRPAGRRCRSDRPPADRRAARAGSAVPIGDLLLCWRWRAGPGSNWLQTVLAQTVLAEAVLAEAVLAEAVLAEAVLVTKAVLAKAVLAKAVWSQIVTRRAAMAKAALVPAVPRWV